MKASASVVVLVAWFLLFSVNLTVLSLPPLIIPIQKELGFSFTEGGLLIALPVLVLTILAIPGGFLTDRVGVYRMLTTSVLLIAAGSFLRSVSNSFPSLVAATLVFAIGYGLVLPILPKFVSENFPEARRARVSGYYTTGLPIGATVGLAFTALIFETLGSWRAVYAVWGAIPISVAVAWLSLTRTRRNVATSRRASLSAVFGRLNLWVVGFIAFMMSELFFIEVGWFPAMLAERGVPPITAGLMVSTFSIMNMGGVLLIPYLSDKYKVRKPFLWITGLISALASFLLITAPVEAGWILIPVLGLAQAAPFVFMFILPAEMVEPWAVGTASGMVISVSFAGGVFGPWFVGYLRDTMGSFAAVPVVLIISSLLISGLTFALPETGRKRSLP